MTIGSAAWFGDRAVMVALAEPSRRSGVSAALAESLPHCDVRPGMESVLVAVELVLESGNPSAEHIENVLHRLKSTPPPTPVETELTLNEEPVADTGRYDSLRMEVIHA